MSDETAIEVIRLRHRLRALASQTARGAAGPRSSAERSAQHETARGAAGPRSSAERSAQHETARAHGRAPLPTPDSPLRPVRTFLGAPFAVDDDSQPGPQETLARFRSLSEMLGDPELLFEHARWQVFFEQLHP